MLCEQKIPKNRYITKIIFFYKSYIKCGQSYSSNLFLICQILKLQVTKKLRFFPKKFFTLAFYTKRIRLFSNSQIEIKEIEFKRARLLNNAKKLFEKNSKRGTKHEYFEYLFVMQVFQKRKKDKETRITSGKHSWSCSFHGCTNLSIPTFSSTSLNFLFRRGFFLSYSLYTPTILRFDKCF